MSVAERVGTDPERLWGGTVLALIAALVAGSLAFPAAVYDRFVWQYFWGPVQADANSAFCAELAGGSVTYHGSAAACNAATGVVAYPGYTLVSEVGYVVVLLLALAGVVFLVRRLDVGTDRRFFYTLLPFVFFGGALRVVEDATDTSGALSYPLNTLVISPVIYVTVFVVTLVAVVAAVVAERRGVVEGYEGPLFAAGTAALTATLGYLVALSLGDTGVTFYPQVTLVVLLGATLSTAATWGLVLRYAPAVAAGTGRIGAVVVWAHAVDGVANVVGLNFMPALGAGSNLVPKHPVNRAIVEFTSATLPESVLAVTGDAWPFLAVKLVAATFVVWVFDEEVMTDSPRYSLLLLVAVVAVGLGPGTRDMLRATFGV
jgi:uncharacterized membrane protein